MAMTTKINDKYERNNVKRTKEWILQRRIYIFHLMPCQPDEWKNEAIRHNQNLRHRDKQIEIHNNKRDWLRRLSYVR